MTEEWTTQDSLKIGGGRPPELMLNLRGDGDDEAAAGRLLVAGLARVPVMRGLEEAWSESAPNQTAPLRPPGATESDVHAQAVQNVQSQISASPVSQNPSGDGSLIPGKFCASCGAQMVLTTGISSKTNKPYKRADCSVDKRNHPVEWLR